jgi:hypothetical protein
MVDGDRRPPAAAEPAVVVVDAAVVVGVVTENGFAGTFPVCPVDVGDDDDGRSDDNRSIADEAAPSANNMTKILNRPRVGR